MWSNSSGASVDKCADGNTISGDGWSSDWYVEDGYAWVRFSSSYDICLLWDYGYTVNSDATGCVETTPSTEIEASSYATQSVVGASMLVNGALSFANAGSPQSMFGMINTIQLILLIPILGFYIPAQIGDYFRGINFSLCSFSFFDYSLLANAKEYKQTYNSFKLIGISYLLTVYNIEKLSMIVFWLIVFHLWLWPILIRWKQRNKQK